jgi:uncharacterized repeat protein (TIGR01451 family)
MTASSSPTNTSPGTGEPGVCVVSAADSQSRSFVFLSSPSLSLSLSLSGRCSRGLPRLLILLGVCGLALLPARPSEAQGGGPDTRPSDFGDAPASYELSGGAGVLPARHLISAFRLGALVDPETVPQSSSAADGDDTAGQDDEDGITISPDPLPACGTATVVAAPSAPGYLNAWADFNGDGDFDFGASAGASEQIFVNRVIAPGGAATASLQFDVPCDAANPLYLRFRFDAEGNLQATNSASGYVPVGEVEDYRFDVASGADISVEKTDGLDVVSAGSTWTYEVTVHNHGPQTATGIVATDTLPPQVTFVSSDLPGCGPPVGQVLTCALPAPLPPGQAFSFDITVSIPPGAAGVLENVVIVETATQPDPDGNNTAVDLTTVIGESGDDYGDAPASFGQVARHAVEATDPLRIGAFVDVEAGHQASAPGMADQDDASGVDDEDGIPLPAQLGIGGHTQITVRPSGTGYLSGWVDTDASDSWATGEAVFTDQLVTGGRDTRLTFKVPPVGAASGMARFRFSTDTGLAPDGDASDGEVEDYAVSFTDEADLVISKEAKPAPVCEGGEITYTVTITNKGPALATGVTLDDVPGPGQDFVAGSLVNTPSKTVGAGACAIIGTDIHCDFGDLDAGSTITVRYRAVVGAAAGATVANTAVIGSTSPDPGENTVSVQTMVQACPLLIEKTDDVDPVVNGETFNYTVKVTNPGPNPVTTVTMVDTLPAEVAFVSAVPTGAGNCTPPGTTSSTLVCTWPQLAVGQSETVTIAVEAEAELEAETCVTVLNYAYVKAEDIAGGQVGPVSTVESTEICSQCAVDVVLVFDVTDSMNWEFSGGGGQKLAGAKDAALTFSNQLADPDESQVYTRPSQVGVVSFNTASTLDAPLTDIRSTVEDAIDALVASDTTNTTPGMREAIHEITSIRHRPSNVPVIVFFSDGANTNSSDDGRTKALADAAKAAGIRIVAIALDPPSQPATQLMQDIASPGLYFEAFSRQELVDIYTIIRVQVCDAGGEEPQPCGDLGDAPDSTNHFSVPMTAYASPLPVQGNFPTVHEPVGMPPGPPGPLHEFARADIYLGTEVTCEEEADLGPDEDNVTNLVPLLDQSNLDQQDDGLAPGLTLPYCRPATFDYRVTSVEGPDARYHNAWIDFNGDGDWQDTISCYDPVRGQVIQAPEWVVQNRLLALPEGLHLLTAPAFDAAPTSSVGVPGEMWMRLMVSDAPAPSAGPGQPADGRGPFDGFEFGETEDYRLAPGSTVNEYEPQ